MKLYVAVFVLLGSVVCAPEEPPPAPSDPKALESTAGPSSSTESNQSTMRSCCNILAMMKKRLGECVTGAKVPNVTLIRHHMNDQRFDNGYVEAKLRINGWYWNFYATDDWDRERISPNLHAKPSGEFEIDAIKYVDRVRNTVSFQLPVRGTEVTGSYSLIFQRRREAKYFIGETTCCTVL